MRSRLPAAQLFTQLSILALATGCAMPGPVAPRADLLGRAIPPSAAARTIPITPATRRIEVASGDSVRFVAGGRAFGWDFQVSPIVSVFDLGQVAPPGLLGRRIPVYVDPAPYYSIGADWHKSAD